ncbi:signal peptide-containing protein [Purpureocillium lilacinum]|uniref:Signal peptide-containing protein n=2 Tax=Purpureocillium lilacinum TaxID=33203 RepID=A0A179HMQ2_PURLI|nr:signal peptide-containing protein [Purpureocillium lilacinum]KAK4093424.1 hypothetical protein Purlil1_2581 [Purpureocillium lilacinum]OAQ84157.1 signal peptide-containing protein [Purpureocillium lilacinum]OAQ90948.1 signal peptide-containing protein [Purpureocillium lilacinum]GJN68456.1 hypothetical protein PLICBS_002499 [Purpureocillium lilacinum]GJN77869.1 hypothetical protein PLIIFM63780_001362 [Purpureocillium lilacinum]
MSFPVAFRSAVFYFVACTPCAKVRHRHKAKEQARKERLEKAKLETEQPGLYRHPSPFNTNPYWQEEISMGPSLPKKAASKNSSQRGLTSSGQESNAPSMSEQTVVGDSRTNFADSLSALPEDDTVSEDWNRRRGYQREDEELWGQAGGGSGHRLMDAFSKARDSAGRLIDATLGIEKEVTEQERRDFYFSPRNPPVNDYHPPVVSSKPPHRDAHKWMLQPPPPAKVMEGKVPVSRAISTGSRSSGRTMASDEAHLGRMLKEKLAMERMRKESNPTETELIESLFLTRSHHSAARTRSRSLSFNDSDDSLDNPFERRRRTRRPPAARPPGADSDSENEAPLPITQTTSHNSTSTHAAQRPKLETIPSTDTGSSGRQSSRKATKRQKSTRSRTKTWVNSPVGDDTE